MRVKEKNVFIPIRIFEKLILALLPCPGSLRVILKFKCTFPSIQYLKKKKKAAHLLKTHFLSPKRPLTSSPDCY